MLSVPKKLRGNSLCISVEDQQEEQRCKPNFICFVRHWTFSERHNVD